MNRILIEVCVALVLAIAGFFYGSSITADSLNASHKAEIQTINARNAKAVVALQSNVRALEQGRVTDMATLDKQFTERLKHEIDSKDRTIADLRAGTVQLRKRFSCDDRTAQGGTGAPGTSTSLGDAGTPGGLQTEDAEFLLREAGRADEVVAQLSACQAIVRKDREVTP